MQQTVELTELGQEVWSEEEAVDQKTKKARRSKVEFDSSVHQTSPWKSKRYGYRFDLVMIKASGEELDIVKCNMCSRTFNKCGTGGLKAHAAFHVSDVVDPRKRFEDSLLKFVICSAQPFYLVNNKSFIEFLDSFQTLVIENTKNNVLKQSKELLPSSNTVSSRIDKACENVQSEVSMQISNLVLFGGGLTLDFAKNRVDYLAVTGHYIGKNWQKTNLVLMFEPVPGMQKTAVNVRLLVESKLAELGLNQWAKVFVTTDEGSNVNAIGGVNHQPCLCHIGATIAKRCCILYKDSSLSSGVKENCAEVNRCLNEIEKLVIKIRQVEEVRSAASEALRLPVQTRWLSYYDMLVSIRNKKYLLELFEGRNTLVSDLLSIVSSNCVKAYLDVLEPISEMVIDLQAEKEPTSNKILGHAISIWAHLNEHKTLANVSSLYHVCLSMAALEAFCRKFGDFSQENWHSSASGRMNKRLVICASFLDPFEHSQLKSMCSVANGLDYDKMKKMVVNEARFLTPDDVPQSVRSVRSPKFAQAVQNVIEKEINSYTQLISIGESPLDFWRDHERYFLHLAPLARLVLSVQASSAPSERAFKELRCIMVDFTRNKMSAKKVASLIHMRTSFLRND